MTTTARIATQGTPRPLPFQCVVGDTLCHVYVVSDSQWATVPERRRQDVTAEHVPGLGWVVASPARLA